MVHGGQVAVRGQDSGGRGPRWRARVAGACGAVPLPV